MCGNIKLRWFLISYIIRKHENSASYTIPARAMGPGYIFISQEVITGIYVLSTKENNVNFNLTQSKLIEF